MAAAKIHFLASLRGDQSRTYATKSTRRTQHVPSPSETTTTRDTLQFVTPQRRVAIPITLSHKVSVRNLPLPTSKTSDSAQSVVSASTLVPTTVTRTAVDDMDRDHNKDEQLSRYVDDIRALHQEMNDMRQDLETAVLRLHDAEDLAAERLDLLIQTESALATARDRSRTLMQQLVDATQMTHRLQKQYESQLDARDASLAQCQTNLRQHNALHNVTLEPRVHRNPSALQALTQPLASSSSTVRAGDPNTLTNHSNSVLRRGASTATIEPLRFTSRTMM